MGKKTKLRALCLLKMLYERTDENHPLSTAELIELMKEEYDLDIYRTTIANDAEQLRQFGIEICSIRTAQNNYFLNERLFDMSELKSLIDAVESSKFITEKKSKELVEKIGVLTSKNKAMELKRNLCVEGRLKSENEQVYHILNVLNDAINQGKKVSFQCFQYNVKKEQRLWREGEVYTFSPYTLVWNGDYYYVAGYSDQHKAIWSFRVDRIYKQAKILKEDAVPRPDSFDEDRYVRTKFRMNSKEPETVELICANETMDAIIDKFGEDVKTYAYNLSSFKAEVEVATSHVFFGWIFGLGGRVVINGPQRVKDEYEKMVRDAAANLSLQLCERLK